MLVTDIPDAATADPVTRSVDHCLPAGTYGALPERQSCGSELSGPDDDRRAGWRQRHLARHGVMRPGLRVVFCSRDNHGALRRHGRNRNRLLFIHRDGDGTSAPGANQVPGVWR